MTRIKGYYTAEELAGALGWRYVGVLSLARSMGFRKLGKLYVVSELEVQAIERALADLSSKLRAIRECE